MPDYKDSKIYKIISKSTDKIYIGYSTDKYLPKILLVCNAQYKAFLNKKHGYRPVFEILKYNDAKINLLELYSCDNIYQIKQRVKHHICANKINIISNKRVRIRHLCKCGAKITAFTDNKHKSSKKHQNHQKKIALLAINE